MGRGLVDWLWPVVPIVRHSGLILGLDQFKKLSSHDFLEILFRGTYLCCNGSNGAEGGGRGPLMP